MSDCVFCGIAAGAIPTSLVHDDDDIIAFPDIHPQAPTHLLIVSRKHIPSLDAVSDDDAPVVGRMLTVARDLARAHGLSARGYRVGTNIGWGAGQSVPHLHFHLLGGRSLKGEMG